MKKLFTCLVLTTLTLQTYAQAPAAGLVAWYKLDGNGTDSGPYSNNLTTSGTVTATTDHNGNAGKAMKWNCNGYMSNTSFNTAHTIDAAEYSVSFYMLIDTVSQSPSIIGLIHPVTAQYGSISIEGEIQKDTSIFNSLLHIYHFGPTANPQNVATVNPVIPKNYMNWHHYTITYKNTDSSRVYIDGVKKLAIPPSATVTSLYTLSTVLNIGGIGTGQAYCFSGALDEIRIYNRQLQQSGVDSIYNQQSTSGISVAQKNEMNIFPNPATDRIHISLAKDAKDAVLQVMSVDGRLLIQQTLSGNGKDLDISSLTKGIYMIRLSEDGIETVSRFVK